MPRAHAVCTIVARNYIAQARVLARSFVEHNPGVQFSTLIIDADEDDRTLTGLGTVVLPADLGVEPDVLDSMHVMYDVMEYATALKPALLMYLYRRGARTASYFDPDIRAYGPLDDVFEDAERHALVLTPHTLEPFPRDDRRLTDSDVMHSGMYNLGFIATGPTAYRFLSWWHGRLTTEAVVDLPNALFTDQRWVDWAPSFARPQITKDTGLNAAYWNLHERTITRDAAGQWFAGDRPLRFFHFSGYDPAKPWLLSKHFGGQPRTLLSAHPGLTELCDAYGRELVEQGHVELRKNPYRNSRTADGLELTPFVRRLYRVATLGLDENLRGAPNPLRDAPEFRRWLLEPTLAAGPTMFSRFEYAMWLQRPDLQNAFPEPLGPSARHFRWWLEHDPVALGRYQDIGVRQPRPHSGPTPAPEYGWSIAGYARAELGVGEAGRRIARAVARTGMPWEMVGITRGPQSRQQHQYSGELVDEPGYANVLLCVNADQTPQLVENLGLAGSAGKRVGYWFWELEDFPEHHGPAFDLLDEVWVSTEFTRRAVAARTDKPVRVVPVPITVPRAPTTLSRRHLGLPEGRFVFLANLDFLSVMERKNPLGAIEAYTQAFGPDDGAVLVVKSINGHLRPTELERLRYAARGRPDVLIRDGYLAAHEMRALVELVDCVVSLHRSEGFGLNLADAMAAGTPVVATAYSGNMEFMTSGTSYLVPYALTEIGPGAAPYDARARWAEPDLHAASSSLRSVHDNPDAARETAARARAHIEQFSVERVAASVGPLLWDVPLFSPSTR